MAATTNNAFELVVGLEIHVQLNTNTKIFCSDSAAFGAGGNKNISTVSLALPGALPKLNKEVIAKAMRIGLALNCTINQDNSFDRKNYFYADLPKGYQITQDNRPICVNGTLKIENADGSDKTIRINRIHLEEDAGKSMHDQDAKYSFVDLNRAGVPLIEIVTEPDIRTAEEASALLTEIRKLVRHLDVSDGNMEEGSLRCDANISVRPYGLDAYGTRCEVKNLNSIRNLRRAIDFEANRQIVVIKDGGKIVQSTLNFDAETGVTSPMRSKEEANDYRYFPDPDLQPIHISDAWLAQIKADMPKLPAELANELVKQIGISKADAVLITDDAKTLAYFDLASKSIQNVKSLVNWLIGPVRALLIEKSITIENWIAPEKLATIINMVDGKMLSQQNALQQLLPALEKNKADDVLQLAKTLDLLIEEDNDTLQTLVSEVLGKFAPQVIAYKNGKKGVLGLFVGEIMKQSGGKADAQKVNKLLIELLEK